MKKLLALSLLSLSAFASTTYATETIHLKKGEVYTLKLESNPTTGYMWELTSLGKENKVMVEELHYQPNATGLIGSGGIQSWKITALGKGSTRTIFEYKSFGEGKSIKTTIFDFIVE